MYSKELYDQIDVLHSKLEKCRDIAINYRVPVSAYNKIMKNVTFINNQVQNALNHNALEADIAKVITDTYIPYVDSLYDGARWYMNRLKT